MRWIPVDEALPEPGLPVLAFVSGVGATPGSKWTRRIRAMYAPKGAIEESMDNDIAEYDEERDRFFLPQGWYESNEYEETNWRVHDTVTHWMPLPEPPEA